jgi:lysophospholipase L1-like esterase
VLVVGILAGCAPAPDARKADILVLGDSILAWHDLSKGSAADALAQATGRSVESRARSGARMTASSARVVAKGGDIRKQYRNGGFDWVVLNGGANDLLSECGCRRCAATFADLIDLNGQVGAIPMLVSRIRNDGARVVLLGYYKGPDRRTPFTGCRDEIDVLNDRLARLAARTEGVTYVSSRDVIDPENPKHFYIDQIHPSRLGARLIGQQLARAIVDQGDTIAD